jgi:hypothetical protein
MVVSATHFVDDCDCVQFDVDHPTKNPSLFCFFLLVLGDHRRDEGHTRSSFLLALLLLLLLAPCLPILLLLQFLTTTDPLSNLKRGFPWLCQPIALCACDKLRFCKSPLLPIFLGSPAFFLPPYSSVRAYRLKSSLLKRRPHTAPSPFNGIIRPRGAYFCTRVDTAAPGLEAKTTLIPEISSRQ